MEDAKGNKVCKKELTTSPYGIASVDFTLADEVNKGDYRIRAVLGEYTAEKTVAVQHYVLPKFKCELKTERQFYQPKDTIKATLQVDYFFGKPVAGAAVEVKASTFDIAFKEFHTWKGKTDGSGHVKFDIKLPDYFVGTPLAKGDAIVRLEAKVTDTADHEETVSRTCPVSDQPIRVALLPEGGRIIPGLENRLFVAALYPDGSPAECSINVWKGRDGTGNPLTTVKTAATGLAEMKFEPMLNDFRAGGVRSEVVIVQGVAVHRMMSSNLLDLTAEARDAQGNQARTTIALSSEPLGDNVLLRLDKAIYQGGERMNVDIRTTAGVPTVYLDVIKSGQTMLTRWLNVKDGQAGCSLDLPESVFGTLEIHAYQVLITGEIIRDTRVVYVNPAAELKIKVSADRPVYTPGAEGVIHFEVTDPAGQPTVAALGVLIVDEAVYAIQEMRPGLEKVFFTLQQELLKPAAQAVYKPYEGLDSIILHREIPQARQQVAEALLSTVPPVVRRQWNVDPALAREQSTRQKLASIAAAVFDVAQEWSKPLVVRDSKMGKLGFAPGLIEKAVEDGLISAQQRTDALGLRLTMARMSLMEKGFSPNNLAKAITQLRMSNLADAVVEHAESDPWTETRGDKWSRPNSILEDAVRGEGVSRTLLKDGWGNSLRFRKARKMTSIEREALHSINTPSSRLGRMASSGRWTILCWPRSTNRVFAWGGGASPESVSARISPGAMHSIWNYCFPADRAGGSE